MDFELNDLIELFAYKVNDLEAGREPRGGRGSVLRLRRKLIESKLSGPLAKRFREVDRRWRELQSSAGPSEPEAAVAEAAPVPAASEVDLGIVDLPLEEDVSPEGALAKNVLQGLVEDVYWVNLRRDLKRVVRGLIGGQRYELRLAYAFIQNFEAYSKTSSFARDFNLSQFSLVEPIPALSDPLVTLDDEEIAMVLLREVFQIALRLGDGRTYPLPLPPEGVVPYLRRFLRRIVGTPESLPLTVPGVELSSEELRDAIGEARRSALAAHEREQLVRELEGKLRDVMAQERRMRMVVEEDRRRFMSAAERLSAILRRFLPSPRGEAAMPAVPEPLGESAEGKLDELPRDATMVTLRRAPTRFVLGGVPMTLSVAGEHTQLTVSGEDQPLVEGEPLTLPHENWEVWAFLRGDYVHVRLEMREGAQLSALLSEGRVLAHLVHPHAEYAFLRLLRAFSARLKGPINYEEYAPESAAKFYEAPLDTLEAFARKGLSVVKDRLTRAPAGIKLMREVATSLGLESEGQKLMRVLSDWLNFRPPTRETMGGDLGVSTIAEQPVSIKAGNIVLSVSRTEDAVYVGAAGAVPRKLEDLLIWPLDDGAVVIAREGQRLAHAQVKIT